jgi:NSS family neurotransmitter:Na+ symporter
MARANFGSKLGVILATAGSAVGLGNIWRFPYMTGQNGGSAFIMVYCLCVLAVGIPCMISEFIIGRHGASNTARAYRRMEDEAASWGRFGRFIGCLGVFTAFLITGYYCIVSGWCLEYMYATIAGDLSGGTKESYSQYFVDFSGDAMRPVLWGVLFMAVTHWVITRGVRGGIEKASKILMPLLFILLLVMVIASCMLPGSEKGLSFLFMPDLTKITPQVFLGALGQSFYSLSIAMGCVCTYASYFSRETRLASSAVEISIIDSMVAILAGMMIFPAAFSVGVQPDAGPSLIFITLPNVFQQAFGNIPVLSLAVSFMFYALLSLAALTSLISLHEVCTAFFQEEMKISRKKAASIVSVSCIFMGIFASLSVGGRDWLMVAGKSLFDWFDFITGQIFLPIGGFFACIFLGWAVNKDTVRDEFTNWGTTAQHLFPYYLFSIRYVAPIGILLIFLNQMGVI